MYIHTQELLRIAIFILAQGRRDKVHLCKLTFHMVVYCGAVFEYSSRGLVVSKPNAIIATTTKKAQV